MILVGADEKRVPADGLFRRVEHRLDALALVLIVAPACDLVHILAAVIAALERVAEIGDVTTELRVEHTMLYAESVTTIRQCGNDFLAISKNGS